MAVERMKLRLDKYLADMGLGTRSQIKKDISKGRCLSTELSAKMPEPGLIQKRIRSLILDRLLPMQSMNTIMATARWIKKTFLFCIRWLWFILYNI